MISKNDRGIIVMFIKILESARFSKAKKDHLFEIENVEIFIYSLSDKSGPFCI